MKTGERIGLAIFAMWGIVVMIYLICLAALGWAAVHFVRKAW